MNSISNCGYTMSRIAKSLERSKETGLHVNLYLHESKDPFEIFSKLVVAGALNSALCHAKRWKTLRIEKLGSRRRIYVEDAQAFSRESRKPTTSRGASPSLFDQLLSRSELDLPIFYRFSRVATTTLSLHL